MRIQIAIGLACVIVMAFYSPAIEANPGHERSFNDLKSKNAENEGANVIDKILMEQRSAGEFLSAFQGRRLLFVSRQKIKKVSSHIFLFSRSFQNF